MKGGDAWDERRKAQEEEYFRKQNQEALKRIGSRQQDKPRLSPITGEPMEQLTIMGVVIDRCPTTKGIWLDPGELEEILKFAEDSKKEENPNEAVEGSISRFFQSVFNT